MYIEFPYIAEQCCSLRSGSIVMIHNMAFFFSCTCSKLSRDFSRAMAGHGRLPEKWDSSTDVFARSRPLGNLWVSPATSIQNCKSDLEERRMKGGLVVVVFCCCCFGLIFFFFLVLIFLFILMLLRVAFSQVFKLSCTLTRKARSFF